MPEAGWDVLTIRESLKKEIMGEGDHEGVQGDTENTKVFNLLNAYKDQQLQQKPEVEFSDGEEEVEMMFRDDQNSSE